MKKIIWYILRSLHISDVVQLKILSYLKEIGWFRSYYLKMPVDRFDKPIPWLTYPFIHFIEPRLKKTFNVFEFGSGNSSIWFAKRVNQIVSVEHDKSWFNNISKKVPENVTLLHRELEINGEYSKVICESKMKFDIIIIDGRDRLNCVKNSLSALSGSGVIIFDNSNVECYLDALSHLEELNFKRIDFFGMHSITCHTGCTSIFYKEDNCLKI
jgi:precorrin-6B methylase 2